MIACDILKSQNIYNLFDYIVGADQVENDKPDPEMIFKTAEALDVDLKKIVMVGDSIVDMEMGRRASVGLVVGVLLLGFQKTIGLLLVAVSCVLFVPAGTYFVWKEASYTGEVYLFAATFLPGVIAGWACLFAFGKPIWNALRAG